MRVGRRRAPPSLRRLDLGTSCASLCRRSLAVDPQWLSRSEPDRADHGAPGLARLGRTGLDVEREPVHVLEDAAP